MSVVIRLRVWRRLCCRVLTVRLQGKLNLEKDTLHMNAKIPLLISSLFVASSLHAVPLVWIFTGHTQPGSTYNGTPIEEGIVFQARIFGLNTNLPGTRNNGADCVETVCFDGKAAPFPGNLVFLGPNVFTAQMAMTGQVAYGEDTLSGGPITSIIFFQPFAEQLITFRPGIATDNPFRLRPIPDTAIPGTQILEIQGPNGLDVFGKMELFSSVIQRVPEVDSTALLLSLGLIALGFLRTQAKPRKTTYVARGLDV